MIQNLRIILPIIPLIIFCNASAQSQLPGFLKNSSVGAQHWFGSFITTQPKAEYIRDSYSSFTEIYFQKQTDGSSDWQMTHKLPQWGVSFLWGNTGSKYYIGNMKALYVYVNLPLIKSSFYTGSFRFGAGPGWVQKPYNIYTNPKNTLIGTRLNAYINMMLRNEFKITSRLFLNASVGFTHLSNGGTTLPNLGLNTPCVTAGLNYSFANPVLKKREQPLSFTKKVFYKISLSAGIKQMQWVGGKYNLISVLQAGITKRFSYNNGYGGGVAFFYNPFSQQNNTSGAINNEVTPILKAGVYGSYEHFLGRFSIPFQLGVYLNNRKNASILFQQVGLRYQVNKQLDAELYLKTHLGQAEFIHAGIGYTL